MRRRAFIGALSGMAATIALPELASARRRSPPPSPPPASSATNPFKPGVSYVTTPLPANAPIDPNSAGMVKYLTDQIAASYGYVTVEQLSSPMHIVGPNTPTRRVVSYIWDDATQTHVGNADLDALMTAVPIPADFYATNDGQLLDDGSIGDTVYSIYQPPYTDANGFPAGDKIWEFWGALKIGKVMASTGAMVDKWGIMWGGRLDDVSKNMGNWGWSGFGANAAGIPTMAGTMTIAELKAGVIPHILGFEMPNPSWSGPRYPATRSDGGASDKNAPQEGTVFRFPAGLDFTPYNLDPFALMVAKAIQKYGMILWDQSGVTQFRCEGTGKPGTYPVGKDPYWSKGAILECPTNADDPKNPVPDAWGYCWAPVHFGDYNGWQGVKIPWDKLVVVAESYFRDNFMQ
jgi:hypothetical protein